MRLLFVKHQLAWPRATGHDVHAYHMMKALGARGHCIGLATVHAPDSRATDGLGLTQAWTLDEVETGATAALSGLQERYRRYWGIPEERITKVRTAAREFEADAVVAVGLEALPYLSKLEGTRRVWYAADEWVRHHLSLVRLRTPATWKHVKIAAIKGLYERTFAACTDRVWVVSAEEARAVTRIMRRPVDIIPNGVDADHYAPVPSSEQQNSLVFWGRLDFEPNLEALEWFLTHVWPRLHQDVPNATLDIFGFGAGKSAEALAKRVGVHVHADVADLREDISARQVAILPFVSGGGIKNKLLEAAALARPVVASRTACEGLMPDAPVIRADTPEDWHGRVLSLWSDANERYRLGAAMRAWVVARHSWDSSARAAEAGLLLGGPNR